MLTCLGAGVLGTDSRVRLDEVRLRFFVCTSSDATAVAVCGDTKGTGVFAATYIPIYWLVHPKNDIFLLYK